MIEKHPLLPKEHLSMMNHFSRVKYLEYKYIGYCQQLKDGEISRDFFDRQTRQIKTLLGDEEFLTEGHQGQVSSYSKQELRDIAETWREKD